MKGKIKIAAASISKTFDEVDELLRFHLPGTGSPMPGEEALRKIVAQYTLLNNSFSVIHGILNFDTRQYIYLTDNVTYIGGDKTRLMDEGLPYVMELFHPDERPVIAGHILPQVIQFLGESRNEAMLHRARATFTTRMRIHTGEYRWFIHQLSILDTGQHSTPAPLLALKLMMEIEGIKQNSMLNLVLSLRDEEGMYRTTHEASFPVPVASHTSLSKRELEVLKLIMAGKTSKQIAALLHISEHTVNNHRKNMRRKKEVSSTPELVLGATAERLL